MHTNTHAHINETTWNNKLKTSKPPWRRCDGQQNNSMATNGHTHLRLLVWGDARKCCWQSCKSDHHGSEEGPPDRYPICIDMSPCPRTKELFIWHTTISMHCQKDAAVIMLRCSVYLFTTMILNSFLEDCANHRHNNLHVFKNWNQE